MGLAGLILVNSAGFFRSWRWCTLSVPVFVGDSGGDGGVCLFEARFGGRRGRTGGVGGCVMIDGAVVIGDRGEGGGGGDAMVEIGGALFFSCKE